MSYTKLRVNTFACILILVAACDNTDKQDVKSYKHVATSSLHVIDGDTVRIDQATYRLEGIDACEIGQMAQAADGAWDCGARGREVLKAMVDAQFVTCTYQSLDRYGRRLARCWVDQLDLNREMIRRGMAVAYRYKGRASVPDFVSVEDEARARKVGLWSSIFENPLEYRNRNQR